MFKSTRCTGSAGSPDSPGSSDSSGSFRGLSLRRFAAPAIGIAIACIAWFTVERLPLVASASAVVEHAQPDPGDPVHIMEDPHAANPIASPRDLLRTLIDASKPSDAHDVLDVLVGDWKVESAFNPAPGAKPVISTGEACTSKVIGGRFLESRIRMSFEGVESETLTLFGYDTRHKHYTLHSIDSFGTYAVDATGPYDAQSKSITFAGEVYEPAPDDSPAGSGLPGNTYPFEMKFDFSAKDRIVQTIRLQMPDQSWFDMTRITFEKK